MIGNSAAVVLGVGLASTEQNARSLRDKVKVGHRHIFQGLQCSACSFYRHKI